MFVFTACRRTSGTPLLLILFEWTVSETVLSRQPAFMYFLSCLRHTDTMYQMTRQEGQRSWFGCVLYSNGLLNGKFCGQIMYTAFSYRMTGLWIGKDGDRAAVDWCNVLLQHLSTKAWKGKRKVQSSLQILSDKRRRKVKSSCIAVFVMSSRNTEGGGKVSKSDEWPALSADHFTADTH